MSSFFTQANKSNEDKESKIEVSTEKWSKRSRDSQNGASAGTGKYQQAPKKQLKITTMWVPSYPLPYKMLPYRVLEDLEDIDVQSDIQIILYFSGFHLGKRRRKMQSCSPQPKRKT